MDDFSVSGVEQDEIDELRKQLLDPSLDRAGTTRHIELLRGKLHHIIERIDCPPSRILAHVRVYIDGRPDLIKSDEQSVKLLIDLLKSCKTVSRKASAQLNGSSSNLAVFAANALYRVHYKEKSWPLELLMLYMEDSLGQRQWVDSPETSFFTSNLLFWSTIKNDDHKSTTAVAPIESYPVNSSGEEIVVGDLPETYLTQKNSMMTGVIPLDDESSGDEEVLEESAVSMTEVKIERAVSVDKANFSDVTDRFVLDRQAAKTIVVDLLTSKSGQAVGNPTMGRVQGQGSSSTSAIVACMNSFCSLPEIRQLASCCLDKWLGNPAIVDLVKSLLCRIADCLEAVSIKMTSGSTTSGTYETLTTSDMAVVREIVKLRLRLKASQLELYKSTLILIANKGIPVAKLIIRSMIAADLSSGVNAVRSDTVKLLLAILNAGHVQATLRISEVGPAEENVSLSSIHAPVSSGSSISDSHRVISNVSDMVGEVFGELCYCVLTKNSLDDELDKNDNSDVAKEKEALCSTHKYWTPAFSRLLLDLLVRLLRGLEGSKYVDFAKVLRGILGPSKVLADAAITYNRSSQRATEDSKSKQPTARRSKMHLIEWEVMHFFADVSIALQLLLASEISTLEKTFKDRHLGGTSGILLTPLSGAASNNNNPVGYGTNVVGKEAPSSSLSLGNLIAGGNVGTGRGNGRGRGGGRGTAISSAPSSMFRGSAMRASAAVGIAARAGKLASTSASSSGPSSAAVHVVTVQDKDCVIPSLSSSSEDLDVRFQGDRNELWSKILCVQENACAWIEELSRATDTRNVATSATDIAASSINVSSDPQQSSVQLGLALSCDDGDNECAENADVHQLWTEWMQKVCCLIQSSLTKIQLDFERNAALLLRDNGLVSTELLRKAAGLFANTASSTAHMALGLSLLEALVYRGIKSKGPGPGDTTGILVDDIEIFPLLFDLSLMSPVPLGSSPRPDLPMPRLAVKSLYWRVSTLCFTLGCARPECLGVYLWTTYPPVKSLMLMAISSRFYSPVEALLEECVGTKETDAALFLRAKSAALNVKKFAVDCILKHRSNSGVELFITADSVQVRWGRVHEIEDALGSLERDLAEYLFSDVPAARPVESVATLSSITNSGTRKRTRVAADDDIEYIRDEREKQGQRREQERGARAERAAARLHRDATSSHERASVVPGTLSKDRIDSTATSSKVITLTLPHVHHSRIAGKASDCGTSNPPLEILGQATEDAAMGLAILSSSMPLSSSAAETTGRAAAEEYHMPLFKIPALLFSDGPPYSTTRGELGVEELIVLRCEGMPRIPPDSIIKTVKILSTKFGFGAKLRSCTDPDFIARAITADPTQGDEDTEKIDATVETADSADIDPDNTARSSAVTLRVSRSAVEASSSWLVPTILEDADAILKRIPNAACLHLLLLSTIKSFTRLNMYGLWGWGEDCYPSDSDSRSSSKPSAQDVLRLSVIDRAEVSRSSTLFFDSHEGLAESLFKSEEHASEIKFLCALAAKIKLLFPSSSTETQCREQRELLKIMLSDLQSSHSDRRAGARLVLSFLAAPLCPSPENSAGAASHSYIPLLPLQHVQDTSSNTLPSPNSLGDAVRLAFVRGPSLVDFTSLLIGLCRLSDRSFNHRNTNSNSEAVMNAMIELQMNSIVESLLVVAAGETECSVLVQMLGALHALHDQLTSVSQSSTTAADVLLNMYVTRRLTSEYLLTSLVRSRRIEFLAAVLSRDIERIKLFSAMETDRGSASIASNGIILTKSGGSGLDQSIYMDISTLKMLLFIALEASRYCDKCGHVLDNVEISPQEDHCAISGAFSFKTFKECASIILSASTTKDRKVHFLPLVAVALRNASTTSRSDPLFSLLDAASASKSSECSSHSPVVALLPFIVALSASSLLDLLTVLTSERQAGSGSSPLMTSGLSTEILKLIVEIIDSKLMNIPESSSSSASEVWHLLIKPYSAKKLERIQCELQPLVLEVLALASADPSESVGSPKYWALHSAALTGLFTLKELRSPTVASTALIAGSLCPIGENTTASIEPRELEPLLSSFDTNIMSTSTSPTSLVRLSVEGEVTEMMPGVGRIAESLVRGNLLEAFYAISDAITRITCYRAADVDNKMEVVGVGPGEGAWLGGTGHECLSQEVLPWFRGLLHSITRQSTHQGPTLTTVTCIASVLISCQREDVLLALALTGMGCDTSERAHVLLDTADISRVARLDFSSTRWCLCAHALVPLLSRDIKQALEIFLSGVAVFMPLATTVGTDGTVLLVLLRQLLSLLAEGIHHRAGRELAESILLIEDYSLKKKSQQDDDRTLEDAILRLLPAVRSFIELINDTVSAVGAGEAEDMKVDHTHLLENGLQCFTLPAGVRDRRRKATHTSNYRESRGLKLDGGGVDQDNAAREGLREESEELLRFIVKSDENSAHIWSDLTLSSTPTVPVI